MLFLCRVMKIWSSASIARRDTEVTRDLFQILCHVCVTSRSIRRKPNLFVYYLKHPPYVLHIVYMVVHVQITSLGLENCNSQHMIILLWNVYNKVMKLSCLLFTYKLESIYLALLSNLAIFSRQSSLIACLSMNQGDISALTSSGIFERRLVSWFIITQVLFHI